VRISLKAACPLCGSVDYRGSKRRGIYERFAFWLFKLLPHRCDECDARFFDRFSPIQNPANPFQEFRLSAFSFFRQLNLPTCVLAMQCVPFPAL
jgi:hypothetical protein